MGYDWEGSAVEEGYVRDGFPDVEGYLQNLEDQGFAYDMIEIERNEKQINNRSIENIEIKIGDKIVKGIMVNVYSRRKSKHYNLIEINTEEIGEDISFIEYKGSHYSRGAQSRLDKLKNQITFWKEYEIVELDDDKP